MNVGLCMYFVAQMLFYGLNVIRLAAVTRFMKVVCVKFNICGKYIKMIYLNVNFSGSFFVNIAGHNRSPDKYTKS